MNLKLMDFAEWLKSKRTAAGMSQRQLAARTGNICSDVYLSRLENRRYDNKKGNPTRPDRQIVLALAEALQADPNDALIAAGYAPDKPQNKREFVQALIRLGVLEAVFEENALDKLTEDEFDELFDIIEANLSLKLKQIQRRSRA